MCALATSPTKQPAGRPGSFSAPPSWQPDCLEPDELELWRDRDRGIPPCHSCPLAFAAEQRAIGRCNGQPSGADDEDEEDQVNDVIPAARPPSAATSELRIRLVAPCPSCTHKAVCGLKAALERAAEVDVTMTRLPEGLSVELTGVAGCVYFDRAKGAPKPRKVLAPAYEPRTPNPPRAHRSTAVTALTDRQTEVLDLLVETGSRAETAKRLGVAYQSVDEALIAISKKGLLPAGLPDLPRRLQDNAA